MKWKQITAILWAAWIFGSSCTVITRQQFISTASTATRIQKATVANAWESIWWVFVKGYHVLEYLILTLLLFWAFDWFRRRPLIAGLFSVAYAASDEWHQTFVPHRGGHVTDVMIDSIGVVLALAIFTFAQSRKKTNSKDKPADH
jgi:hypothetical protein